MNKKKLPKAILWTADAMRDGWQPQPAQARRQTRAACRTRSGARLRTTSLSCRRQTDDRLGPQRHPANVDPADQNWPGAGCARATIVERHANFSAVGGIIPLPIANVASITAIIVRMVRSLSQLYGVPFEHNRARAIVIGLMGGIMPTGLATVATSTLVYFVPASNLLGLAVSSVTASAYARGIGQMFIEHFENGSTLVDFPSAMVCADTSRQCDQGWPNSAARLLIALPCARSGFSAACRSSFD